jgi:hypothetical protein
MRTVSDLEERLALQSYVVEAGRALADAEKRLLTALGQATTLEGDAGADAVAATLREQVDALRAAARELSDWLDGGAPEDGLGG